MQSAASSGRACNDGAVRVLLIAAPGAGKGTQAVRIADRYHVVHVSSGDLLRSNVADGTALGQAAAPYIASGDLVPDDLIGAIVLDAVVEANRSGGYVLDGFPRTVAQAEVAYELAQPLGITLQAVLHLDAPEGVLVERLRNRGEIEARVDDDDDVIRHRLEVYNEHTAPLVSYYRQRGIVTEVDSARPVDEVSAAIFAALDAVDS